MNIPQGMLPMCYPSDHVNGNFIPNWAMWFVIELEGRVPRTQQRPANDQSTRTEGKRTARLFRPIRERGRAAREPGKVGFRRMVESERFRPGCQLSHQHALCKNAGSSRKTLQPSPICSKKHSESMRRSANRLSTAPSSSTTRSGSTAIWSRSRKKPYRNLPILCILPRHGLSGTLSEAVEYPLLRLWPATQTNRGIFRNLSGECFHRHLSTDGDTLRYGLVKQLLNESVDQYLYMADQTGYWGKPDAHGQLQPRFCSAHRACILPRPAGSGQNRSDPQTPEYRIQ